MNYDIIIIPCGVIPDELMDQLKALAYHAHKPAFFGISNSELLGMKDAERMIAEVVKESSNKKGKVTEYFIENETEPFATTITAEDGRVTNVTVRSTSDQYH